MKITILSLFPSIITPFFENSIMKKVVDRGIISYEVISIRDFSNDKHKRCDDAPYGGGAGMVLKAQPISDALEYINSKIKTTIFVSPSGVKYTQKLAYDLSKKNELVIICGRYEGLDQRVIDLYVDLEISVGDYVLSSGEIAALVIIDSVYRLLDGVISPGSLFEESFNFEYGLLEYPHYTRPYEFGGLEVPGVLLSGHHEKIRKWRFIKSVEKTKKNRYDLYLKYLEKRGEKDGFNKKN
ncbi:tRNA (guanosine(37)-N1)-methyltransferase TrmD [Borrelia miyamotoi]|uniref:tRNA (guanine-N(1)-)-methyltransferase n=1 Tax=Borrelia miyamotoi TaxID=47466 RepID=A0AAX3JKX5_9SPIR|nr:tRNA (guanosine(37)-N1)-methyltransferase TrmD [Borrelia miyamotoi]QFP41677.1 tRNA (guanosine(37)-N1)-methyltransferase TrmD [Borrelia miyamotoi]QFP47797.1 tRNA (guanosine(37)-N1)-methyltransferase TrmD [Borrelia miyamotoi]QGT55556.1 tRNA (guanosine(37)-N1)-methyltransferase TrmD [Borrelia miyamotoi]QGT56340.1 tRNA (guanosine(37)-N1)-methyltransferase TrmD [Borrelia miyamotoi]WAZ71587.1 tRNA (guanosine(37)-N1)-methyltransferase TrmD [Borrelia miyamotoi]